ncbi:regulatory particle non-ATPase [Metarhizium acridum]|nr:regulatory particle non-ATPase [Metarhizium acridum]
MARYQDLTANNSNGPISNRARQLVVFIVAVGTGKNSVHYLTAYSSEPPLPEKQAVAMAERNVSQILGQLKHSPSMSYPEANALLSQAKLALLSLKCPHSQPVGTSPQLLALARETFEQGALFRYQSTQPRSLHALLTGLSLLLLLTAGRYAEFHSELEGLANRDGGGCSGDVEGDRYLGYPIRLERWLMEGSYDRVWKAMKSSEVPCDEYGVFSEILKNQIRSEIASSSERAYPSLPISSTKSLLFLDSEGDVIQFCQVQRLGGQRRGIYTSQTQQTPVRTAVRARTLAR